MFRSGSIARMGIKISDEVNETNYQKPRGQPSAKLYKGTVLTHRADRAVVAGGFLGRNLSTVFDWAHRLTVVGLVGATIVGTYAVVMSMTTIKQAIAIKRDQLLDNIEKKKEINAEMSDMLDQIAERQKAAENGPE